MREEEKREGNVFVGGGGYDVGWGGGLSGLQLSNWAYRDISRRNQKISIKETYLREYLYILQAKSTQWLSLYSVLVYLPLVYLPIHGITSWVISQRGPTYRAGAPATIQLYRYMYKATTLLYQWTSDLLILLTLYLYFSKCINSRFFRCDLARIFRHCSGLTSTRSFRIHREPPGGRYSDSQPTFRRSEISRISMDGSSITVPMVSCSAEKKIVTAWMELMPSRLFDGSLTTQRL